MQLNSRSGIRSVLDSSKKAFVRTLANSNSLPHKSIPTQRFGRWHTSTIQTILLQSRVHLRQIQRIRTIAQSATSRNSSHVGRTGDDDTGIVTDNLAGKEKECTVNVEDRTGTLLATDFANRVTLLDFRAIAVGCYCVAARFNLADDLGREDGSHKAVLVEDTQGAAVEFRDDTNGRLTISG